ncbi:hypothetical protein MM239_00405 [Belliella sp. DSM 111904]|uniref:DUF3311 domain-containing protein n=1 Tax=Belliella filtrata TaxID=2923435 RepID=A0ABS9UUJ4_9BACT|nr:hypothetical protein [Belliella filtrata]MCH7407840.1 hypothetical protein [Belliella filtrata]
MKESLKSQYLWALFFLGMFLLNYPMLAIFDIQSRWLGIPVLYFCVFSVWIGLILLTFIIIKRTKKDV